MTLETFIADKPVRHIILDFGGTLLQNFSPSLGFQVNEALKQFIMTHAQAYDFSIWSHSPHEQIVSCLKNWELDSFFSTIVSIDNMLEAKPSPASFKLIAKGDQFNPQEWLLVGDANADELAAKALGIYFYKWV
jgi:phosphoglycolate phosphatase-like HAD superfamily hydrolase